MTTTTKPIISENANLTPSTPFSKPVRWSTREPYGFQTDVGAGSIKDRRNGRIAAEDTIFEEIVFVIELDPTRRVNAAKMVCSLRRCGWRNLARGELAQFGQRSHGRGLLLLLRALAPGRAGCAQVLEFSLNRNVIPREAGTYQVTRRIGSKRRLDGNVFLGESFESLCPATQSIRAWGRNQRKSARFASIFLRYVPGPTRPATRALPGCQASEKIEDAEQHYEYRCETQKEEPFSDRLRNAGPIVLKANHNSYKKYRHCNWAPHEIQKRVLDVSVASCTQSSAYGIAMKGASIKHEYI